MYEQEVPKAQDSRKSESDKSDKSDSRKYAHRKPEQGSREPQPQEETSGVSALPEAKKTQNGRPYKRTLIIVFLVAVVFLLCAYLYHLVNNRSLQVVVMVGDLTVTDKQKAEGEYFITFQAGAYNLVPPEMNSRGFVVRTTGEIYDMLVLDVPYEAASLVFRIPRSAARKAGYEEEQANVQALWQENILSNYATVKSVVWSVQ
ncbi:MAG: hypothetical protein LBQ15_05950 [Clostridium sp.]|jgi:hypothetical protein|nr:hypothetical protein [Clostridium sp.]